MLALSAVLLPAAHVPSQLRANLLLVVQRRTSAFVYDDEDRRFCEVGTDMLWVGGCGCMGRHSHMHNMH